MTENIKAKWAKKCNREICGQKSRKIRNSYFYIEKWTVKAMCEVYYQAKRDKKEAT